jgi:hypothetical protein
MIKKIIIKVQYITIKVRTINPQVLAQKAAGFSTCLLTSEGKVSWKHSKHMVYKKTNSALNAELKTSLSQIVMNLYKLIFVKSMKR